MVSVDALATEVEVLRDALDRTQSWCEGLEAQLARVTALTELLLVAVARASVRHSSECCSCSR